MMTKRVTRNILFCLSLFFILGIYGRTDIKKDILVDLDSRIIKDLSPEGLTLTFYLKIKNNSTKNYYLAGYSYRFIVEQAEYVKLTTQLDDLISLPAQQQIFIAWPVKITYTHLFHSVPSVKNQLKAVCYLSGELFLANQKGKIKGKIPVAFSGESPIFKKPEAQISRLKINQMSIGGADIDFRVKFSNPNGFELFVDRIKYQIKIGGHKIGAGEISGDKNLPPQGDKEFRLPLLISFFEIGREIAGYFQQSEVTCQFSGEVELRTVWGRLTLPYHLDSRVPVEKKP